MTVDTARATARPRTRRIWALTTMIGVAAVVLAADAISKAQVLGRLPGHPPVRLLDGLITLDLTFNAGAAFGVGTSYTAVIALIVCGVIAYIIRTARRLRSRAWTIALGLLLGGAMGNLGDRLFRAPGLLRGQVVDWINLPHFPWTFNLADASITCAAVIIAILALRGIRIDGTTPAHAARIDPDRPGYEVDGTSGSIETARRHIDSLLARWRTPLQPQEPPSPQAPLHPGPPNGVRVPLTT